jgi:uncharacterized protein
MSRRMTEQERQGFLAEPRVAVLSVASDSDRPLLTVPLWYGYQPGSNVTIFTVPRVARPERRGSSRRRAC